VFVEDSRSNVISTMHSEKHIEFLVEPFNIGAVSGVVALPERVCHATIIPLEAKSPFLIPTLAL
jgi:hypothetical protein